MQSPSMDAATSNTPRVDIEPKYINVQSKLTKKQWCLRIFYTLKGLKFRQIIFMVIRRVLPDIYRDPQIYYGPDKPLILTNFSCEHTNCIVFGHFKFLNQISTFAIDTPDWRASRYGKLWRYNLHYFDFLHEPIGEDKKAFLINDWIEKNTLGCEDAWEPYPVSLRVVNWVKYFSTLPSTAMSSHWQQSLYLQGHWLSKHLEFHIDANHLFKNIVALVVWSHYFCGNYAVVQRIRSLNLLRVELAEQFNADGSHYERSPMYHCLVLHYALDAYNLIRNNTQEDLTTIKRILQSALIYLGSILLPNGRIPLLKDSAYGIAPEPYELFQYGKRLGLLSEQFFVTSPEVLQSNWLQQAGYFIARQGQNYLLFDIGTIGPRHQPGHAHCDALHLELVLNGQAIFCDTGVFCYQGADRQYCRSTAAHNTLRINGAEQSDIWGQFRVGGRAQSRVHRRSAQSVSATVKHFSFTGRGFRHKRSVTLNGFNHIQIEDTVLGEEVCDIELFWHLAPELTIEIEQGSAIVKDKNKIALAVIKIQQIGVNSSVQTSEYFPQFGIRQASQTLVLLQFNVRPPWTLLMTISPIFAAPPLDEA
jgi:uncharacterized heparinase superfamily protein